MSFFGGLLGGIIGVGIFGHSRSGKYIILKFKSEKEFEDLAQKFRDINEKDNINILHPSQISRGFTYKKEFYVPIKIFSGGGSPRMDCIFFIKENKEKVIKNETRYKQE